MPIAARATATRNWISQPALKMSARIPPSRLAAIPSRGASVDVVADAALEQSADAAWIPRHQRIRLV
jgi:hypothetical protein